MNEDSKANKFENGYFWELYVDLERQYADFLEYVPYLVGNEKTYSFKLLNMILSIGGHIDSAFKEMARHPDFSNNEDCQEILQRARERKSIIDLCLKAFNKIYGLSGKKVIFKCIPDREIVKPFEQPTEEKRTPQWWFFYNDLKHDLGFNIEEANLRNARDALAGAFLLHVIHIPSIRRLCNYDLVKSNYSNKMALADCSSLVEMLVKKREYGARVETSLFIYDYEQSRC